VLFAVSAFGAALPRNLAELVAARFIGGLAIGVASVLAPIYVAEVAPREIRGRLVALNQMAIVTGILMAYAVNWGLSFMGSASWRWMFATAAIPTAVFFVALFFVPESPRWLIEKGLTSQAVAVLGRIGGAQYAQAEAVQIKSGIEEESGTLAQLLEPGMRRPLVIAIALAILQQITGINTVLFYGSIIFREHMGAASESSAIGLNVLIGSVNFAATIVALMVIDKLGRKPLLMFSAAAMGVCQLTLGALFLIQPPPVYAILALMFVCTAAFAVGLGPGVWVVLAEIFPTKIRGRAMGVASVTLWSACVVLTLTYLTLVSTISITGAFWVYATMCAVTLIFVWKVTPETKGRSLEEIEQIWKR
jgi:SP family arabinose:H+ symporter-like MFS transporter